MEVARKNEFVFMRLEHGEDILESVRQVIENESSTMVVVSGLGMISEFELGYFDQGKYLRRSFQEPHELLALQGTVACRGEPRIHIHTTVANKEHEAFGGHLMRGKAWMSNEISILRLEGLRSVRTMDSEKKVGILHIDR